MKFGKTTEAQSEMKLRAVEEESTTEAAHKGLKSPPTQLQQLKRPPTEPAVLLALRWIFNYLSDSNLSSALWNAWRTSQCSNYPSMVSHALIIQRLLRLRRFPPTTQYSSHAGRLVLTET